MTRAIAINGSPRMEKGNTAMLLAPFIQGMAEAGCDVELFYPSHLRVRPCACGELYCWNEKPGECCIKDSMQPLYPKLRAADILVLATPVYIPLPGDMQNVINRLCPLLNPVLEMRVGRTRARFREDVAIRKVVLVVTSGWWEKENCSTVVRIVQELAEDASVEFAGALIRPHIDLMRVNGMLTAGGEAILSAARRAGYDLVKGGAIDAATLEAISRPLVSLEELARWFSQAQ